MITMPKGIHLSCSDFSISDSGNYLFLNINFMDFHSFNQSIKGKSSIDEAYFPIGNMIIDRKSGQIIYNKELQTKDIRFLEYVPGEDAWYFAERPKTSSRNSKSCVILKKMSLPDMEEETLMEVPKGEAISLPFSGRIEISPDGNFLAWRLEKERLNPSMPGTKFTNLFSSIRGIFHKRESQKEKNNKLIIIKDLKDIFEIEHSDFSYCKWLDNNSLIYWSDDKIYTVSFPDGKPVSLKLPYRYNTILKVCRGGWAIIRSDNQQPSSNPDDKIEKKGFLYNGNSKELIPFDYEKFNGFPIQYDDNILITISNEESEPDKEITKLVKYDISSEKVIEAKSFKGVPISPFNHGDVLTYKLPDREATYLISKIDFDEMTQKKLLMFRAVDYKEIEILDTFVKGDSGQEEAAE